MSTDKPPKDSGCFNYLPLFHQLHNEALQKNAEVREHWDKLMKEYETLEHHLSVLPNDLTKNIMVPIGPKALMKGMMVHTNEILVCLGDGWFVKQSAVQAAEICKRRKMFCKDMLSSLEREQNFLSSRSKVPFEEDVFGGGGGHEILEVCTEEELTEWKAQHRQKEEEYRKKLSELRNKEKVPIDSEDALWKRLEELELQEELEDELDRLHQDEEEEDGDESEITDDETGTLEDKVMNVLSEESLEGENAVISRRLALAAAREIIHNPAANRQDSYDENPSTVVEATNELAPTTGGRRVSFADIHHKELTVEDPIGMARRVSFVDSQSVKLLSNDNAEDTSICESTSQLSPHTIQSAENTEDTISLTKRFPSVSGLKSILKNKGCEGSCHTSNATGGTSENTMSSLPEIDIQSLPNPVSSEVHEHDPDTVEPLEKCHKRPMSHFRASRQGGKGNVRISAIRSCSQESEVCQE